MIIQRYLEKTPQIVSAFVLLSLIVSVSHDYLMFRILGVSISQLPMSLEDHIKSSVDIYFAVASMSLLGFLYVMFRISPKYDELSSSNVDDEIRKFSPINRLNSGLAVPVGMALFNVIFIFFADSTHTMIIYLGFAFMFTYMALIHVFLLSIIQRFKHLDLFIMFAPAVFVGVLLAGAYSGFSIKEGAGARIKFGTDYDESTLILVKSTQEYLMVWDLEKSSFLLKDRKTVGEFFITNH